MKTTFSQFLVLVFSFLLIVPQADASSLKKVSKQLAKGTKELKNKKIAVLAFPYHNGGVSSGSSIVSERLTTDLVNRGVVVVERRLLKKVLEEQKLNETGLIDPTTAKTIGKILGVDAIVTGTLIDLEGGKTEVNARLIYADSGEILTAAHTRMKRSWKDRPRTPLATKPKFKESKVEKFESPKRVAPEEAVTNGTLKDRGLSLSNESFPPGRRRYHSTAPPEPKKKRRRYRRAYDDDRDYDNTYRSGYSEGFSEALSATKKKKKKARENTSYGDKKSIARERIERAKWQRKSYHKNNSR